MAGIYIHVPFCKTRCHYCDFFKSTKVQFRNQFLGQLLKELENRRKFFPESDKIIESVYFGGGTPSLLDVDQLKKVLAVIRKEYSLDNGAELTIEVNPDDLDPDYLEGLKKTGFNRISLGIQSFFDEDLKRMGRRHNADQSRKVIDQTFDAGFKNVGIDLIYGLPWSDQEKFLENLKIMNQYPLKHLSAYHLTIEPGTQFGRDKKRKKLSEIEEEQSEQLFWLLHDEAEKMGFDHYEISNFCRDELYSRHNTSYWIGKSYLGVGPGAHSFDGIRRFWNKSDLHQYLHCGYQKGIGEEILSENDRFNERLMLGLRTKKGIDLFDLKNIHPGLTDRLEKNIQKWIDRDFLMQSGGRIFGSRKGWFLIDGIIEDLFEV
ncbi:radical SAM family heme chaperone HemW [Marinilabilia salmonicolor]|nr:radical SAM family heme chaperone HemW [Marinilabilia salmonicolor]